MKVKRIDLALEHPKCLPHTTIYKASEHKTYFKSLPALISFISREDDRKQSPKQVSGSK